MEYTYFPVELGQLGAQIEYRDFGDETHDLDGVRVTAQYLDRPGDDAGLWRQSDGMFSDECTSVTTSPIGRSLALQRRTRKLESILHAGRPAACRSLCRTPTWSFTMPSTHRREYPAKKNWGHSTYSFVIGIALPQNVKRLILTHHDPMHNDDFLSRIEERPREIAASLHSRRSRSPARTRVVKRVVKRRLQSGVRKPSASTAPRIPPGPLATNSGGGRR